MSKQCILFLCQDICKESIARYNKLNEEKLGEYDLYWVIDEDKIKHIYGINFIKTISNSKKKKKYRKLKYAGEELYDILNTGTHFNCILNYIEAYMQIPSYDFYWCVEFDVYMKDFNNLFISCDNFTYDNICTGFVKSPLTCYRINEKGQRYCYNYNNKYNLNDYPIQYKGFYTIFRLSNKLFKLVYDYYASGYFGFFEQTISMITMENNMSVGTLNRFVIGDDFIENWTSNNWNPKRINTIAYSLLTEYGNIIIHPIKLDKPFSDFDEFKNTSSMLQVS